MNVKQLRGETQVKAPTIVVPRPHNSNWPALSNSISYRIAVWNKGKSNQVILAGTVFNGEQLKKDRYLAEQAYHQYFEPAINYWCANNQAQCQQLDQ